MFDLSKVSSEKVCNPTGERADVLYVGIFVARTGGKVGGKCLREVRLFL